MAKTIALPCITLFIFLSLFVSGQCLCYIKNWLLSFDSKGLSSCTWPSENINGLYRDIQLNPDNLHLLEAARCCHRSPVYVNYGTLVVYPNWGASFDLNFHWNMCPTGFFLNGLWREEGRGGLHLLNDASCTKPVAHPYHYNECYDQDVTVSFDSKGWSSCRTDFLITGLYRGACNHLYCIERFRCCKMVLQPVILDSLAAVKTRVMEDTLQDISLLAHYLGYGWSAGCRALFVGEDFLRSGDTWKAHVIGCEGHKANERLNSNYAHWKFYIKDIKYGNPVFQDLVPETVDSGTLINNDVNPATQIITREIRVARKVIHNKTSSWKYSHELGVEISYEPPSATGGPGGSLSYKFGYENTQTTLDSTQKEQVSIFRVNQEKTIGPLSSVKWKLVLAKARVTMPYTATIGIRFSAELRGFLRWGGGWDNPNTNYHHMYRGKGERPTFNYPFGNASVPFYQALKQQSQSNSLPWLWADMRTAHRGSQYVINRLINEGRYDFTLTGKFEEVRGTHVTMQFDQPQPLPLPAPSGSDVDIADLLDVPDPSDKTLLITTVAQERAGDPPPVSPNPPQVVIDKGHRYDIKVPVDSVIV